MEKRGEFPAGSAKKDMPEAGVSLFLRRRASLCVLCRAVFACSCSASVPPKGGRRKTSFGTGRFFCGVCRFTGKNRRSAVGGYRFRPAALLSFPAMLHSRGGVCRTAFFPSFLRRWGEKKQDAALKEKGRRNIRRPGAPRRRGVGREITSRYRTFHRKRRTRGTCRRTCPC